MINIKFRIVTTSKKKGKEIGTFFQIIHNFKIFLNCFIFCFHNIEIMIQAPLKLHFYSLTIRKKKKFQLQVEKKYQRRTLIGPDQIMCPSLNQSLRPEVINIMIGLVSCPPLWPEGISCHKVWGGVEWYEKAKHDKKT